MRTLSKEGEESRGGNVGNIVLPAGPRHTPEALESPWEGHTPEALAYSLYVGNVREAQMPSPVCCHGSFDIIWPLPFPVEFYWNTVTPMFLLHQ